MHKMLKSLLVVMVVFAFATGAYAEVQHFNSMQRIKFSYGTTGQTGPYGHSDITTDNRLIGFIYSDTGAGTMEIYDDAETAASLIIIRPAVRAGETVDVRLPYPYDVTDAILTKTSSTTARVTILYE